MRRCAFIIVLCMDVLPASLNFTAEWRNHFIACYLLAETMVTWNKLWDLSVVACKHLRATCFIFLILRQGDWIIAMIRTLCPRTKWANTLGDLNNVIILISRHDLLSSACGRSLFELKTILIDTRLNKCDMIHQWFKETGAVWYKIYSIIILQIPLSVNGIFC